MSTSSSVFILLLLSVARYSATPGGTQTPKHGIITDSENPFDGGAVESCEQPVTSFCNIDYEVPTSIARLAAIIEYSIVNTNNNTVQNYGRICASEYTSYLCKLRFPRCQRREGSQEMEVVLRSLDCSAIELSCERSTDKRPAIPVQQYSKHNCSYWRMQAYFCSCRRF